MALNHARAAGPLEGVHVLVVEDHEDTCELFRLMLEYFGAVVVAAASVDEAVARSRHVRIDVVVTDIGLGRTPGTWFVEDGRGSSTFAHMPVIAVTGRDLAPTLRRMFAGVVAKPVDAEDLCQLILAAVDRRR